jgi:hypothetical protein
MSPENEKPESPTIESKDLPPRTTVDESTAGKVKGGEGVSPRDPATGLPTGKRM